MASLSRGSPIYRTLWTQPPYTAQYDRDHPYFLRDCRRRRRSLWCVVGFELFVLTRTNLDAVEDRLKAGAKTYARDAFGRVASSTAGATKTGYTFDGSEVLQEKVGTAATTHYTRGLGDRVISRRRAGTATPNYYYCPDAVGSVTGHARSGVD